MVAVAQLVRASVCGTEGRGFESRQPPHPNLIQTSSDDLGELAIGSFAPKKRRFL